jgi:3-dehydroquinate dehydratase / shikimate dehydrogenase
MKTNALSPNPQLIRSRIGKVCVAIIGTTISDMIERASAAIKETNFIEFRLDYLDKPALALPKLKQFLSENTATTAIATCRRSANGGKFDGNVNAQAEILAKAATSGFQLIDLELESATELKKAELLKLRETGAALLISFHDFKQTPDLDAVFERIRVFEPEFIKIVPTAKTLSDNVTMMRFLERVSDHSNIIGTCMGDAGIISRVLGVRAGSVFTFAAATQGEETAPGQIAARTLVETYRIDHVDAATKVYGVAGNPIRGSLSPLMMNTAFRRETVNAVYLALQTDKLADLLTLVREIPIQGLSITMPLKQEIMAHLAHTDPLSAKIGACNTVLRAPDGKLYGFNTDVAGIVAPLERRMSLRGAKVLVLGAGGAARAAVFGLRDKGAEVSILNRTAETAQKLAKQSGAKVIKKEAVAKTHFDVILNATPIGMTGNKTPQLLGPDDLNTKLVFDLVYNPIETPLLTMARRKGIPVIAGVEMFVQQGARQFEIWTGKPAPEEEMLRVVLHSLRQRAESATDLPVESVRKTTRISSDDELAEDQHDEPEEEVVEPVKEKAKEKAKTAPKAKAAAKVPAKVATKAKAKTAK